MPDAQESIRHGETRPLFAEASVTSGTLTAAAGGTINLYDSAGAVVAGFANQPVTGYDVAAAATVRWWYSLPTSGLTAGADYRLAFSATALGSDAITRVFRPTVEVFVEPVTSKFDESINRLKELLGEEEVGDAQLLVTWRQARSAVLAALDQLNTDRPRVLEADVALSAADWTYSLSGSLTGWVPYASQVNSIWYPKDAAVQARTYLGPLDYVVDEEANELRLLYVSPSAGETAVVEYTVPFALADPSTDTLSAQPRGVRDAVARYAAGEVMESLANGAIRTSSPQIAADLVGFDQKPEKYQRRAMDLKEQARLLWSVPRTWYL